MSDSGVYLRRGKFVTAALRIESNHLQDLKKQKAEVVEEDVQT